MIELGMFEHNRKVVENSFPGSKIYNILEKLDKLVPHCMNCDCNMANRELSQNFLVGWGTLEHEREMKYPDDLEEYVKKISSESLDKNDEDIFSHIAQKIADCFPILVSNNYVL